MLRVCGFVCLGVWACSLVAGDAQAGWKAGTSRAVITPQEPQWMAGYGGRTRPADGKLHDLFVRTLVLEDERGRRVAIVSTDTLGINQQVCEDVVQRLQPLCGLERSQVLLNASHTHCGPVLHGALPDIYPLQDDHREVIRRYTEGLANTIVASVQHASAQLEPVELSHGMGTADFAVNRRTNREPDVPRLREANLLQGPVDHAVPVLAVRRPSGELRAVLFAYACHNTVLDFYRWCGDYAGFAQALLEERYPNVVAMFAMGCGADQNPLPRRTVRLAQQYGAKLANAVDDVLATPLDPVKPRVETQTEIALLRLADLPAQEVLQQMAAEPESYRQRWARRMTERLASGPPIDPDVRYPVQAWRLGDELLWITLGGEVVVDYSLKFKAEFGYGTWVIGYANDVMAYIPSARVLMEGGYEGQSSMMVYGQPAERWADDVEQRVTDAVRRVVGRLPPPTAP